MAKVIPHATQSDAEIDAIIERGKRAPKTVAAIAARYIDGEDAISVRFETGLEMRLSRALLATQDPVLGDATPEQLAAVRIFALGDTLLWDEPLATVGIGELLHGFPRSCRETMAAEAAEMGRRGGSKKSPAKTAAVRANGKKGGRPKKLAKTG
jgi:hypothetical protein